jgi:hypothetical protein
MSGKDPEPGPRRPSWFVAYVPKAVVELGDDQACVMIRSDFGYQPTYERCDGRRASEFAAAVTPLFLAVPFDTEPEQGIAPQLRRLGHRCSRYKTVVLEIAPGPKSITSPRAR